MSDFVVSEVSLDGKACTPINTDSLSVAYPVNFNNKNTASLMNGEDNGGLVLGEPFDAEEAMRKLTDYISNDHALKVLSLFKKGVSDDIVQVCIADEKEKRAQFHKLIRTMFSDNLISSTMESTSSANTPNEAKSLTPGKSQIKLYFKKKSNKALDARSFNTWPDNKFKYVHFTLQKNGKTTEDAVQLLSKLLKFPMNRFGYAGTKDNRAMTRQKVSAFKVLPEKLFSMNQKMSNIQINEFCFAEDMLRLGDLSGNQFRLIIRCIEGNKDEIIRSCESIREKGFINYFGMQRFGTSSIQTHELGFAVLANDYDKVLDLVLKPRLGDTAAIAKAREFVAANPADPELAIPMFPLWALAERSVLISRKESPNAPASHHYSKIPHRIRSLYVHAAQSYIWNHVASLRHKRHGLAVLEGDIVISDAFLDIEQPSPTLKNDPITDPIVSDGTINIIKSKGKDIEFKFVTQQDLTNKTYSINNVLLPIPGSSSIFPNNVITELYTEVTNMFKIDINHFTKNNDQTITHNLTGSYRKFIASPKDFSYTFMECELDDNEVTSETKGTQQALELIFTLPSSCYATMLFRELFKIDTSKDHHSQLSTKRQKLDIE